MNWTNIDYLDYTTNPTAGCSGKGCKVARNCWASKMAKRLGRVCELCPTFRPHVHWDRFDDALTVKKPSVIGISFMGDFFDEGISNWVRKDFYLHFEKASWHRGLILTKQPQNIDDEPLPDNVAVGVSVNTRDDLWRIECLKNIEASLKVVSFEPLYEDLGTVNLTGIGWIIIGGQTRPTYSPNAEWVDALALSAGRMGIPVFLKNNLPNHGTQQYPGWVGKQWREKPCLR